MGFSIPPSGKEAAATDQAPPTAADSTRVPDQVPDPDNAANRPLTGLFAGATRWIAIGMAVWQMWVLLYYPLEPLLLRGLHLGFALTLGLLLLRARPQSPSHRPSLVDGVLILLLWGATFYVWYELDGLLWRQGLNPTTADLIFGTIMLVVVLEVTRRAVGNALPVLCLVFVVYTLFGERLPGMLGHTGYTYQRFVSFIFGENGFYGMPVHASATLVFPFLLFGAFLSASGGTVLYTDLARSVAGWARGGPGKVSVIASGLFGTVSGSAVANVVVTGNTTIPAMRGAGYRPHIAAAVEAAASTGGQLMPPVMGTAAFLMVAITGIPYIEIAVAALIPAVLYYLAVFLMIDFEAVRTGVRGLPRSALPSTVGVLKERGHLLLPLVLLIAALAYFNTSIVRAAVLAIVVTVIMSWFRSYTRVGGRKILAAIEDGAKAVVQIAATVACAGIVVGTLSITGLGSRLAGILVAYSQGSLLLTLIMTMLVCIALGMGMPTVAAYAIGAATMTPALIKLGMPLLSAHLFIFYFTTLSAITPPVATASFAAAAMARTNMWQVSMSAMKFAAAGFLVPFMFAFGPSLLLQGSIGNILIAVTTSLIGVLALAGAAQGWLFRPLGWWQRGILLAMALLLLKPGLVTDLLALTGLAVLALGTYVENRIVAVRRDKVAG